MNQPSIRLASATDFSALRRLYNDIIIRMDANRHLSHAQWSLGGYPTDAFLKAKIADGELWLAEDSSGILGAMVLNNECNPGYAQAAWHTDCEPQEVLAIHTLGVSPNAQGKGIGKALVHKCIELSRERVYKSIRLDVIDTNPAAGEFYSRLGFTPMGRFRLDYPGAVCTDFDLYELVL